MRYVYKLTAGRASDLRFARADYQLQAGEVEGNADALPDLAALQTVATADLVVAERSRRLALGFNYTFPNADPRGTVRIGTTAADMDGWGEVSEWSRTKLALGQTTAELQIVTNSGPVTVTPMEWQSILDAGTAFRQPIWAASFMLQGQNPIPLDYALDAHWPAVQ